jgi:hypothetical protein
LYNNIDGLAMLAIKNFSDSSELWLHLNLHAAVQLLQQQLLFVDKVWPMGLAVATSAGFVMHGR